MLKTFEKRTYLLNLLVLAVILLLSGCAWASSNKGEPSSSETESITGYIVLEGNTLYIDEVEVMTTEEVDRITGLNFHHPERMAELGLEDGDMPNGYYIHNPSTETTSYKLTDGTTYTFTDINLLFIDDADGDRQYTTTAKENFIQHLNTSYSDQPPAGHVPFFIEVRDGNVVSITEIFWFTQ